MIRRYFSEPGRVLKGLSLFVEIFGTAGIYHAIFVALSKRKKLARVAPRWARQPLYLRLNSSDIMVFRQVFIEREYDIIRNIRVPLEVMVDAGANVGLTSAFVADRYPHVRIYAVEPDSGNFELLKLNTRGYGNVRCICGALWNRDEPVAIDFPEATEWAFRVRSVPTASEIQGYRLRTLMDRLDLERISLLKMDIEGAEYEVLGDAASWIDAVDHIVIELHDRIRPGCSDRFRKASGDFETVATSTELTLVSRIRDHGAKRSGATHGIEC
jgi:FkbM family methyltransferase